MLGEDETAVLLGNGRDAMPLVDDLLRDAIGRSHAEAVEICLTA